MSTAIKRDEPIESKKDEEVIKKLQSSELFSSLCRDALVTLCEYTNLVTFPKQKEIIVEGQNYDQSSSVYILLCGAVSVFKKSESEQPVLVSTITDERVPCIGEGSLLGDLNASSTVITSQNSVCLSLTKKEFEDFCTNHPKWGLEIVKKIGLLLAHRLRKTSSDLTFLLNAYLRELNLTEDELTNTENGFGVNFSISKNRK